MTVVLEIIKQGNLIADAEAFTQLRKVNRQVKAQSQFDPSLSDRFQAVTAYFAAPSRRSTGSASSTETSSETAD